MTQPVQPAQPAVQLAACAKCHNPFHPDDTRPDGRGTDDGIHCRHCVDRCHESTDASHECAVCR